VIVVAGCWCGGFFWGGMAQGVTPDSTTPQFTTVGVDTVLGLTVKSLGLGQEFGFRVEVQTHTAP
jgi:hypothetical protein